MATPVAAQDNRAGRHDADPTIVVTAQYRPQDLVDVPITLSAFTGEMLDRIGIDDFEELGRFVPGFEVQNQSVANPGFVMRGLTSDSGVSFAEPRISVFQDGVSVSKVRGSMVELFDVERVEIAKGPQTTLYGRSALTGAVNIIQNKADPRERSAYLRLQAGNFDSFLSEGAINLPLAEGVAVRLSGRYRLRDGTVDNLLAGPDLASIDSGAARASVRLEPTRRVTLDFIATYEHDESSGTPFVSLTKRQTDPESGAILAPLDRYGGGALHPSAILADGKPLGLERDIKGGTVLAEYRPSEQLTLSSVTGWRRFDILEVDDADGIALPILSQADRAAGRQFSQEFRLRFDGGSVFSAFAGANFLRESGSQTVESAFDERLLLAQLTSSLNGRLPARPDTDPAPLNLLRNPAFVAPLLQSLAAARGAALTASLARGLAANLATEHQESQSNFASTSAWDLFADATVKPIDRLELTAGLRYTHERKRSGLSSKVLNGRSVLAGVGAALNSPAAIRDALLAGLASPGAANIPASASFPLFGLGGQPTPGNGQRFNEKLSDGGLTYRAAARFSPDDNSSIFLSYARGRRPKVLAVRTPTVPAAAPIFEVLRPETLDSFELGAKANGFGNRLFLSGTLFHYLYRNFQTEVQDGAVFVVTNAGKARSTGFEGELRWRASDSVDIFASYAYNYSRFRSGVRRGNHFRLSPDHSLAIGGQARVPVGGGHITLTPTMTYQSNTYFDTDNDRPELQQPPNALVSDTVQDEVQKGFALFNVRAGYAPAHERWRAEVFAENLFDKPYLKDAGNTGDAFGLPTGVRGTPRTYGVSVRFAFEG